MKRPLILSLTSLLPAALCACGNTGGGTTLSDLSAAPDLAVAVADLAVLPDLAAAPDLVTPEDLVTPPDLTPAGPFCRNTPVAGTCAATFFADVARCYQPFGGCTFEQVGMFDGTLCWGSGSQLKASFDMQKGQSFGVWSAGLKECMTGEVDIGGGAPIFTLHAGGKTLVYEEDTGATTCPDGSKVNIGAMAGGCQAVLDIIEPNTGMCKMGKCP